MHILRSGRATATVDPLDGGRLKSLIVDQNELLGSEEVQPGNPRGWYYGSFRMAPYVGRIKNGRFRFDGVQYVIPPNAGPHAGHGLAFDVPWSTIHSESHTTLRLATDFDARWPFGGRVEQEFVLTESELTLTMTTCNDDRPMPASIGFHPWFLRDIGTGGLATYSFSPAVRFAPAEDGFPRIPSTDLGKRPWDDVFTQLAEPPTISWPNGPTLRITSDCNTWIVYEQLPLAFCIESVTAPPDTLGTPLAAVVTPGNPLVLRMEIAWQRAESLTPPSSQPARITTP